MPLRITGQYPTNWHEISTQVKQAAKWRCIRCRHVNTAPGHILTVHHWDGDRSNCVWWNLLALCQKCHLQIQHKVNPDQPWVFEHSDWFKPYVAGFYAYRYLGKILSRDQIVAHIDDYLGLEARAILGTDPLPPGG